VERPEIPPPSTATSLGYAAEEAYRRQRLHSEGAAGRKIACFKVESRSGTWRLSRIAVYEKRWVMFCDRGLGESIVT